MSYTCKNVPMQLITLCNNTWIILGHNNYFMYHHIEHILSVRRWWFVSVYRLRDQHGLILTILQHIMVCIVTN